MSAGVATMTSMLMHEGLPAELAYLPLIESGYRPLAVSPAGAGLPILLLGLFTAGLGIALHARSDGCRGTGRGACRRGIFPGKGGWGGR